jgi:Fe-S-cluster containining protein
MKKKRNVKLSPYSPPVRLSHQSHELARPWLSNLFDAFFSADQSIYAAIDAELKKGKTLACGKGCSACCRTHVTIPVYPLELMGIYWYLLEIHGGDNIEPVIANLLDFTPGKGCPFLIEGVCGIHPVRPLACRFFNVFSKPCEEGEDAYYTRRQDVWAPDDKMKDKALSKMLPYHGIVSRTERREAEKTGFIHRFVKNLQEINWPKIAVRLKNRDQSPMG